MSEPPTIHAQVLAAIDDPRAREIIRQLIELCMVSAQELDSLDQFLYRQMEAARHDDRQTLNREDLEWLAHSVLDGVRQLQAYLSRFGGTAEDTAGGDDDFGDLEFDLGGEAEEPASISSFDRDIADVLDGLGADDGRSAMDRWNDLTRDMASMSFGLASQLEDFDSRFQNALGGDRVELGLRALNDVGNSLIDAMFALMGTVCEAYLDEFDRSGVLPGHRDALGKALLVRRGLTDLRSAVHEHNSRVQESTASAEHRQAALQVVATELGAFLTGEAHAVMRPADRMELAGFHAAIAGQPLNPAAQACEGLDKYLESLASVSQREILIKHDREVLSEVAGLLEGVIPLMELSPSAAIDMLHKAFASADSLYGYRDDIDAVVASWKASAQSERDRETLVDYSTRLAAVTRPAD